MFKVSVYRKDSKIDVSYECLKFSGGELHIKNFTPYHLINTDLVEIKGSIFNSDDFMELALLTDTIRRIRPDISINFICPYFPYARQDRVNQKGEALSVKVMANFINSLNFKTIIIWDPHSDVTPALLNNVFVKEQYKFLWFLEEELDYVLVSPDAGAVKKIEKAAQKYHRNVVYGSKHRNTETGELTGTTVDLTSIYNLDRRYLIVDDICDGGRTFVELANVIHKISCKKATVDLYVTHGIFSKGLDALTGINKVYTANPFPNVDLKHPKLTVI